MSSNHVNSQNMKLEVVVLPVSDVERTKDFYKTLRQRLDADFVTSEDCRVVALQPGGAGTVVHLYNKANDVTIAYCVSYDVFLAARPGRVTEFDPAEIK